MKWDKVLKMISAIGGFVAGMFGGWDSVLIVLLAMMIFDYTSGLIVAWMGKSLKTETGKLSSKVGAAGIAKKGLMLMVVVAGNLLDNASGTSVFRDCVCWFYIANEGISIAENLTLAGVPFPAKIKQILQDKLDEENKIEAVKTLTDTAESVAKTEGIK